MAAICDLNMLEVVRDQIARGEITGVTFWPFEGGWQANVRRPGGAYAVAMHEDPFHALLEVVSPAPKRQRPVVSEDAFGDLLG